MSVLWMEPYETDNFPQQLEGILQQTKPLYDKLHAFTRLKLREQYGKDKIPDKSPIPASLLGWLIRDKMRINNIHSRSIITLKIDVQETCGLRLGKVFTIY